ncbi:MAG: class E sortase, partial [Acidimicrobiia bacterium]
MAGPRMAWLLRGAAAVVVTTAGFGATIAAAPTSVHVEHGVTTVAPATLVRPAAPTTTAAPLPQLPVPEPEPADPYAPTPEVVLGRIEIPAIGVSDDLHEGVTLTAIDRGPSHWPGTALPGGLGNVVVAGHRTTHTAPFYDLDRLQPGDELVFTLNDGSRHVYALTGLDVVEDDANYIVDQTWAHTATLFACHP